MWGEFGDRKEQWIHDESHLKPKEVAVQALIAMMHVAEDYGIVNWWAHNGGKFDIAFMLEAIDTLHWKATAHFAGGRVVQLEVKNLRGITIRLYDSQAVVPSSLKKAAESFELPSAKLFTEEDYKIDARKWHPERLRKGCMIDCELVLQLLDKIEELFESEGGKLRSTFSSGSMSVLSKKVHLVDMRKRIAENSIARMAYCGGRVEVFRHKPESSKMHEWDINSSYPHSMSSSLPFEPYLTTFDARQVKALYEEPISSIDGVFECTVDVRDCYLPVLPYVQSGVFFPFGKWRGFFQKRELLYAHSLGQLRSIKIHSAVTFLGRCAFQEFIDTFYKMKSVSKGASREFYKLVLNGAYGKFGQKPERENLVIHDTEAEALECLMSKPDGTVRMLSKHNLRFQSIEVIRWSKYTHYALAGAITAESRILLHKYLSAATNPAYCDTDSVHSENTDFGKMSVSETELGAMKLEAKDFVGRYYAPKLYHLKGKDWEHFASKGFQVDDKVFKKVVAGDSVTREVMQLIKSQLRNNNTASRKALSRRWSGLSMKRCPIEGSPTGDTRPWNVRELIADSHKTAMSPLANWEME